MTTAGRAITATPPTPAAPQPLAGLRVVEFTHMVTGPSCGMVPADLGAEVIKASRSAARACVR